MGRLGSVDPTVAGSTYIAFPQPMPCLDELMAVSFHLRSDTGTVIGYDVDEGSIDVTWHLSDGSTIVTSPRPINTYYLSDVPDWQQVASISGGGIPKGPLQRTLRSIWAEVTVPFAPAIVGHTWTMLIFHIASDIRWSPLVGYDLNVSGVQGPIDFGDLGPLTEDKLMAFSVAFDSPFLDELTAGEITFHMTLSDGSEVVARVTAANIASLGHTLSGWHPCDGAPRFTGTEIRYLEFLHDKPTLFPVDRSSVLAGWTTQDGVVTFDTIWAYDSGSVTEDILPLCGPDSLPPTPYGPFVAVYFDTLLAPGTYHRRWWL
jgi:hypothetical protein